MPPFASNGSQHSCRFLPRRSQSVAASVIAAMRTRPHSLPPLLVAILLVLGAIVGTAESTVHAGSSIKSDEEVLFFTTAANWSDGSWVAPIHGWIFEPEEDSFLRSALVESLRGALQVKKSQESIFRKRLRWFLVDNERGKRITVRVGGVEKKLSKSKADGHFRGTIRIPGTARGARAGQSLRIRAKTRSGDPRSFEGTVMLVGEEGLSVISDIDDTIKVTGAYDRKLTLERTFLHSFKAIPGMASAYRVWSKQGAAFHYVSASPWHLADSLAQFMKRTAFPSGSLHLRDFRIKSSSRWNLLKSSKAYKIDVIEQLLAQFPKRRFILVGDTGEKDPEVYSEIASRHPTRIDGIFLHLVRPNDMNPGRTKRTQGAHNVPVTVFSDAGALSP